MKFYELGNVYDEMLEHVDRLDKLVLMSEHERYIKKISDLMNSKQYSTKNYQ